MPTITIKHDWRFSCQSYLEQKLRLKVPRNPADIDVGPLLHDSPLLIKEPGPVHELELLKHVAEGHPKHSVVTKDMAQLLEPVGGPFLASVRPRAIPLAESGAAPSTPRVPRNNLLASCGAERARKRLSAEGLSTGSEPAGLFHPSLRPLRPL